MPLLPWTTISETNKSGSLDAVLTETGLNWDVKFEPLYVPTADHKSKVKVDGYRAVTRQGEGYGAVGVVRSQFQLVQHRDFFELAQQYVDSGVGTWESMFEQEGGRYVGALVKLGKEHFDLGDGDQMDLFLTFLGAHDGTKAPHCFVTPIKLDCTNAMQVAMRNAKGSWKVPHRGDVAENIAQVEVGLQIATAYADEFKDMADRMRKIDLDMEAVSDVLKEAIPAGPRTRTQIQDTFLTSPRLEQYGLNGWRLFNAATEWSTHERSYRSDSHRLRSLTTGGSATLSNRVAQRVLARR